MTQHADGEILARSNFGIPFAVDRGHLLYRGRGQETGNHPFWFSLLMRDRDFQAG
jgi:hypothetical protein